MSIRKRRTAAPQFRIPVPYNPVTGEHARLRSDEKHAFAVLSEDLTTDADKVGSAKAELWAGDDTEDGGGWTVTVHNRFLGASETLANGTRVLVLKIRGKWYVTQASCG